MVLLLLQTGHSTLGQGDTSDFAASCVDEERLSSVLLATLVVVVADGIIRDRGEVLRPRRKLTAIASKHSHSGTPPRCEDRSLEIPGILCIFLQ